MLQSRSDAGSAADWPTGHAATDAPVLCEGDLSGTLVRTRRGFDSLEADWNDLAARCGPSGNVFQTFNWHWHWANTYLSRYRSDALAILIIYRRDRLVSLWPLLLSRTGGLRMVEWMGAPVSQYGDVLLDPVEDRNTLLAYGWRVLRATLRFDAVHLRKVRADATIAPLLHALGARVIAREQAPFLDIASAADYAAYESRYSAKTRKNRRRLARRLAEAGDVTLAHLADTPAASLAAREAVALRQRTLTASGRISPALADPSYARFFASATSGERPCGCRVTRMQVGDALAAASIDITVAGHRAAHIIAHEPGFGGCGPGILLVEDWVRSAHTDHVRVLDMLAPGHDYKWDWADSSVDVRDYVLATSLTGALVAEPWLARVRPRLKAALEGIAAWRAKSRKAAASSPSETSS